MEAFFTTRKALHQEEVKAHWAKQTSASFKALRPLPAEVLQPHTLDYLLQCLPAEGSTAYYFTKHETLKKVLDYFAVLRRR